MSNYEKECLGSEKKGAPPASGGMQWIINYGNNPARGYFCCPEFIEGFLFYQRNCLRFCLRGQLLAMFRKALSGKLPSPNFAKLELGQTVPHGTLLNGQLMSSRMKLR